MNPDQTAPWEQPDLGSYCLQYNLPGPRNRKLFFLFLNQNICCGYSKEPSH